MQKKALVIGSGGREHALAYRLSRHCSVVVSPGNAGIAREFECIPASSIDDLLVLARRLKPDLIVVGPEEPLANGIVDLLQGHGFAVFGPSAACARLEASKHFTKELCLANDIPTARFACVRSLDEARSHLQNETGPIVVKADGLCAGKGVIIAQNSEEALLAVEEFLKSKSQAVVLEAFLLGEEATVIGICDGDDAELFAAVRDHKRIFDGNLGPNTGGMGVIGPLGSAHGINDTFLERVRESVFLPTLRAMKRAGSPFRGFLYAGLMVRDQAFQLLEFNVRLGDPEAQALLFGTDCDLFGLLSEIGSGGRLPSQSPNLNKSMRHTAVVVMACPGYPQKPQVGDAIMGLPSTSDLDAKVFFAGVRNGSEQRLQTASGRVLSCAARAESQSDAIKSAYALISHISFPNCHYRKDIGAMMWQNG